MYMYTCVQLHMPVQTTLTFFSDRVCFGTWTSATWLDWPTSNLQSSGPSSSAMTTGRCSVRPAFHVCGCQGSELGSHMCVKYLADRAMSAAPTALSLVPTLSRHQYFLGCCLSHAACAASPLTLLHSYHGLSFTSVLLNHYPLTWLDPYTTNF